MNHEHKAIE